ncbi:MAG: rod shape-determining protein MreC [Candidatus Fischerbacteria bacterium RBG_13_37_8]|uniref:Cell shape-determining protein MreC n=1 Tax=Candidatus Fischerbacteria bacterium RBG_13_37_8 TaxID=1817863 RepID=A0A1F5VRF7_9BACT|nr:MAG: rod shape-determining protein MreC [Candidatus Fischerbacteria bacterium RBG_13_37_8]
MAAGFDWKFHISVITINIILFILIAAQAISPSGYTYLNDFAFSVLSTIEQVSNYPINKIKNLGIYLKDSKEQETKIRMLNEQVSHLKVNADINNKIKEENATLRQLLNLQKKADYHFMMADVIGYDFKSEFLKTMRINRGSADGIRKHYPVLTIDGVVGTIIKVGRHTSEVLMIIGASSAIGVTIQECKIKAIAYGTGGTLLKVKYIPISAPIRQNLSIITSGLDAFFPAGLPVGITTSEIYQSGPYKEILVKPYINFYYLGNVVILIPDTPESADSPDSNK